MKEAILKLNELFAKRLETQTNWGRVQVKQLHLECVNEVLLDMIVVDNKEKQI